MLENLANSDLIILGVLIGLILIVGITCIVLTIKGDGKKKKEYAYEVKDSEPEIQMSLATDNIPDLIDEEEKIDSKEEVIMEKMDIPTYEEISEAINKIDSDTLVTEKIIVENNNSKLNDLENKVTEEIETSSRTKIEDVLKQMEVDIEKQKYEEIDRYEEEQEENAVISYQELLNRKMALNNSVREVPESHETKVERVITTYETVEPEYKWKDEKQFASSEFISPIFGRQDAGKMEYPTVKKTVEKEELKRTYLDSNADTLDETVDLLNTLKEYRRNL